MKTLYGRPVTDIEIDGVDHRDMPDYSNAFVVSAVWDDTGEELNEDDLNALQEEHIYSLIQDRM